MIGAGNMDGKAALVTGAASGLGRATAIKLAEAGADLCLVDIDPKGLAETAALLAVFGHGVLVHPADLSDFTTCAPAIAAAVEKFGRLDALCNVAGLIYFANSHDMPADQVHRTIAVNLTAPFFLSQAAIPHLLETEGAIVNVTSCAAHSGQAYTAVYCATKAGLAHMTKAMAMEYQRKPIRINAVSPGGMLTNIANNLRLPEGCEGDLIQRFSGMRGMVEVDDVADMVAYLASPAGRGHHGSVLTIDAGITAG